jgi:elongation factor 2
MPRFKQLGEIQKLMHDKERIRNVGIIAHIDHGKTTLTDSLLAGTGLLSPTMAGTARVLDYLEEEQKRKITIKAGNISLLFKSHVINLVDTPGHVDFAGKVARALRAIDGAIVVVDAVEGIMAQTEVVTRQALEERVKPVLFINKMDRLFSESQLNASQVEARLLKIISGFNDLIDLYGEISFKKQWKVDAAGNGFAFGSALEGWGLTLSMARLTATKISDIFIAYNNKRQDELRLRFPAYEAIFELVIQNLPNPREAQAYRLEKIWDGHGDSDIGKVISKCRDDAPLVICVTNVASVLEGKTVVKSRLFSGVVKKGNKVHLVDAQADADVADVYLEMGGFREEVTELSAGNIAVLSLTGSVKASETLIDIAHRMDMVPFEAASLAFEPVLTIVVEPKNPKDLPLMQSALDALALEDPDLSVKADKETGEYLLNGMGELHLEIALKQLGSHVPVIGSSPRVVYRETVTEKGATAMARSPNKHNMFVIQVEPLLDMDEDETGEILSVDEYRNLLVDRGGKTSSLAEDILEPILSGFDFICHAGPLCGEPLKHVKASLLDLQISDNEALRGPIEIMRAVGKAVFGSFLTGKPVLLEPVYKTTISVPSELAAECQRILTGRRGKVTAFGLQGLLATVTGFVPVAESFGLARELRSATSGRAVWQSSLECWERVPEKLEASTIAEIRSRKGLPAGVPEHSVFSEEKR